MGHVGVTRAAHTAPHTPHTDRSREGLAPSLAPLCIHPSFILGCILMFMHFKVDLKTRHPFLHFFLDG